MTHVIALLLIPMLIAGLRSCGSSPPGHHEVREIPVRSVTFPEDPRSGEPTLIHMTCATPTPCWEFDRTDISRTDTTITIRVFARYDGRPCIQVPGTLPATARVTLPRPGVYRFLFHRTDSTAIERSLTIR